MSSRTIGQFDSFPQPLPRIGSIPALLECFKCGQVAKTSASLVITEQVQQWNFEYLRQNFPDQPIYRFDKITRGRNLPPRSSMSELCEALATLGDAPPRIDGNPIRNPHGVINARRLKTESPTATSMAAHFGTDLSFVWVGVSAGTFHRDKFDNVLVQLCGSKCVTVFSPEVSLSIATKDYPSLRRPGDLFCDANVSDYPALTQVPWYRTTLSAGEGLVIPSGAFHSVVSQSADAVSINSFAVPSLLRPSNRGPHARSVGQLPWWSINLGIRASRMFYSIFGRPLIRLRAYEVM